MRSLTPSPDSLTFIGTATTVLRLGPFTLLTDPNFLHRGQFAYLGKGLVSRRLTEPACSIADLPPLDAIVLSHLHGDHWDRVAKRELDHATPVLTTPRAARALRRQGFRRALGLATWESQVLRRDDAELTITALPGRHARGPARALLPPVMGSLLELRDAVGVLRLYLSGDDYGVFRSPPADFRAEVGRRGLAARVRWVDPGGEVPLRGDDPQATVAISE